MSSEAAEQCQVVSVMDSVSVCRAKGLHTVHKFSNGTRKWQEKDGSVAAFIPERMSEETRKTAEPDSDICKASLPGQRMVQIVHDHIWPRPLHVLRLSKDGIPVHPLYLPGDLKPVEWRPI